MSLKITYNLWCFLILLLCNLNYCVLCEIINCGGTFSGYQYTINSPNYPGNYPANQNCTYFLHGMRQARCEQEFHLQFLDLNIRATEKCENDYLQIGESNIYCGRRGGLRVFKGMNNVLKINFHSGREIGMKKGFRILVTTLPCVDTQTRNATIIHREITPSEKEETLMKNNENSSNSKKSKSLSNHKQFNLETVYPSRVKFPTENENSAKENFSQSLLGTSTYLFLPPTGNGGKSFYLRRNSTNLQLSPMQPERNFSLPILPFGPFRVSGNSDKLSSNLKTETFVPNKIHGLKLGNRNEVGYGVDSGTDSGIDFPFFSAEIDTETNINNNFGSGNSKPTIQSENNFGTGSGTAPGIGYSFAAKPGNSFALGSGTGSGITPSSGVGFFNSGHGVQSGTNINSGTIPGNVPNSGIVPEISGNFSGSNVDSNTNYYSGPGSVLGINPWLGTGSGSNSDSGLFFGTGLNPGNSNSGSGNQFGTGSGINPGSGLFSGTGSGGIPDNSYSGPENQFGTGSGINPGSGLFSGTGLNPGNSYSGSGNQFGTGSGINPDSGLFSGTGSRVIPANSYSGPGNQFGTGSGINPDSGLFSGTGSGGIPVNSYSGSGNQLGTGSGINPGSGLFSGTGSGLGFSKPGDRGGVGFGINPGNGLGSFSGTGSKVGYDVNSGVGYNGPGSGECCRPKYPSQRSLIASPGFPNPNFPPTPFECGYTIYKSSFAACRVRFNFKFFNFGNEEQFCRDGFLAINGREICGCKTGLSLVFSFDNFPAISLNVRYNGFPKSRFNGFFIEAIQENCDYYPLSQNRNDLSTTTIVDDEELRMGNLSKKIDSKTISKREGYFYSRPMEYENFHPSEKIFFNSCQNRLFFDWIVAAKEAFFTGAGCSDLRLSRSLMNIIPKHDIWNKFWGNCEEITAIEGVISSPFYPNRYPNNVRKCYRFYRAPGFCQLEISIFDFNLEPSFGCAKDYFMFSGQNKKRYCGDSLSGTTTVFDLSQSKVGEIYFVTDTFGNGRGFSAGFVQKYC